MTVTFAAIALPSLTLSSRPLVVRINLRLDYAKIGSYCCPSGEEFMSVEQDIADLKRRITLLEEDAKGERLVARHTLRKVTENETILLDVKKEVTELRNDLALFRADLPGIIANVIGALLRDRPGK
jgi:hypothetical protein